jgi:endo-1,4-beta-D-glucanase Y
VRRVLVLLSCGLGLLLAGCGATSRNHTDPSAADLTHRTPKQLAIAAARSFLETYALPDGRVQRTDQGGDTVSEGQAYGMLAAAAIGDRARFEKIWSWTRRHLEQSDGLFAFHWQGGHVVDREPAADADLDTARALLVGACRFGAPSLRTQAIRVGKAILADETARAGSLEVLLPGPWAKKPGNLAFNPSYVDPTTLSALAAVTGDPRFRALATSGIQLVNELTRPLPPDWAMVDAQTGRAIPVSGPDATSGPGLFSFDAPRTLVRFAAASSPAAHAAVARAWSVFAQTPPQDIVTQHELSGPPAGSDHNPVTLAAVAGAAKAAGASRAVLPLLAQAQRFNLQHPTYYGSAWVALGRLMLTTNLLTPCREH